MLTSLPLTRTSVWTLTENCSALARNSDHARSTRLASGEMRSGPAAGIDVDAGRVAVVVVNSWFAVAAGYSAWSAPSADRLAPPARSRLAKAI